MKLFNEGLTDVQRINRRLQAAIDHYPQLAAFRFSLQQPNAETVFIPEEDAVKFVNTLQETISRYIDIRQSEGKITPPTILRALWGVSTSRDIQMLLLVNSRTFCGRQHQEGQKTVLALIRNAWACVHGDTGFTTEPSVFFPSEPCLLAYRTTSAQFEVQQNVLRNAARQLPALVTTYQSDV